MCHVCVTSPSGKGRHFVAVTCELVRSRSSQANRIRFVNGRITEELSGFEHIGDRHAPCH